ncbi:MAG TPA: DNA gyrase inhibitor YacG [Cellvibrionaceae bacterium]
MNMPLTTLSIPCPTCKKPVLMTAEFPHRPFCSHRCRLIDLGAWADESHCIAGEAVELDIWTEEIGPND